nr:hypothetical protein [Leptolyngbya sp. FACHB-541]
MSNFSNIFCGVEVGQDQGKFIATPTGDGVILLQASGDSLCHLL